MNKEEDVVRILANYRDGAYDAGTALREIEKIMCVDKPKSTPTIALRQLIIDQGVVAHFSHINKMEICYHASIMLQYDIPTLTFLIPLEDISDREFTTKMVAKDLLPYLAAVQSTNAYIDKAELYNYDNRKTTNK